MTHDRAPDGNDARRRPDQDGTEQDGTGFGVDPAVDPEAPARGVLDEQAVDPPEPSEPA